MINKKVLIIVITIFWMYLNVFAQQSQFKLLIETYDQAYLHVRSLPFQEIISLPLDSAITDTGSAQPPRIWYGASLKNVLEKMAGTRLEKIHKLSISAPDGYSSVISGDLLTEIEYGLLAYRLKGEAVWPEKYGACRLVFPSLRTMYWVNNPFKMVVDISNTSNIAKFARLHFLHRSERIKSIKTDFNSENYVPVMSLLAEFGCHSFRLISGDGLFREYTATDLVNRFVVKMQPDSTWILTGVNVPDGLKTRDVLSLVAGDNVIFLKKMNQAEAEVWSKLFLPKNQTSFELKFVLKSQENPVPSMPDFTTVDSADVYQRIESSIARDDRIDHAILKW